VGSKWCTSREAAQRFVERLTPQLQEQRAAGDTPIPTPKTLGQRRRAAERPGRSWRGWVSENDADPRSLVTPRVGVIETARSNRCNCGELRER
jgi:hypothetical protein